MIEEQDQIEKVCYELAKKYTEELHKIGVFNKKTMARVSPSTIEIGVQDNGGFLFASDVCINIGNDKNVNIHFGAGGSFNPESIAPYWRTLHASQILLNWEAVIELSKQTCAKLTDFIKTL